MWLNLLLYFICGNCNIALYLYVSSGKVNVDCDYIDSKYSLSLYIQDRKLLN